MGRLYHILRGTVNPAGCSFRVLGGLTAFGGHGIMAQMLKEGTRICVLPESLFDPVKGMAFAVESTVCLLCSGRARCARVGESLLLLCP